MGGDIKTAQRELNGKIMGRPGISGTAIGERGGKPGLAVGLRHDSLGDEIGVEDPEPAFGKDSAHRGLARGDPSQQPDDKGAIGARCGIHWLWEDLVGGVGPHREVDSRIGARTSVSDATLTGSRDRS